MATVAQKKSHKRTRKSKGLTKCELDFVNFYLCENTSTFYNQTESYIQAFGYQGSRPSAGVQASNLMARDDIKKRVKKLITQKTKVIDKDWIEKGIQEVITGADYARDKMKGYELLAKTGRYLNDEGQAGGQVFVVGVPRPVREDDSNKKGDDVKGSE